MSNNSVKLIIFNVDQWFKSIKMLFNDISYLDSYLELWQPIFSVEPLVQL